jgi:hypothetical protein
MFRRYNRWHSRFDQPDPSDESYDLLDPQSLNRYSYVQNDPANFVDPSGLLKEIVPVRPPDDPGGYLGWGEGDGSDPGVWSPPIPADPDPRPGGGPQRRIEDKIRQHQYERRKKEQQKKYDNCVKTAFSEFRKDYLKQGGEALAGSALVIAGGYLYFYGLPTEVSSGIGLAAAQAFVREGELGEALHAMEAAGYVAIWPLSGGFALIAKAVGEGGESEQKLRKKLADCASQTPLADHEGVFTL